MQSALHIKTKVLPGNRVELQLPSGSEGQEVNVFVVLPMTTAPINSANRPAQLAQMADDPDIQRELAAIEAEEALDRIRSRPRANPADFGFPDSTALIRDDRNR